MTLVKRVGLPCQQRFLATSFFVQSLGGDAGVILLESEASNTSLKQLARWFSASRLDQVGRSSPAFPSARTFAI
jgi:hypothetical protein